MSEYKLTINLNAETLQYLYDKKLELYLFKGASAVAGAKACLWIKVAKFSEKFTISWDEKYDGFFHRGYTKAGAHIDMTDNDALAEGEKYTLHPDGNASKGEGATGIFSFAADKGITEDWSCGLALKGTKIATPIVSTNITPSISESMKVNEKILGYLASKIDVGDVVIASTSQTFVIDYNTSSLECSLSFDKFKGWTKDEQYDPRITFIDNGTDIAKQIINEG